MKYWTMIVAVLAITMTARAEFIAPTDAPVDRLVKNATTYVAEHPDDAQGYYVLGRIHYLAWSIKSDKVPVWREPKKDDDLPQVVPETFARTTIYRRQRQEAQRRALAEWKITDLRQLPPGQDEPFWKRVNAIQQQLQKANWTPPPIADEKLDVHALQAVRNFNKAIELKPKEGLYHLGLASLCDQYADRAAELKWTFGDRTEPVDAGEAKMSWLTEAMKAYRQAFELTVEQDAKREHPPVEGVRSLVSFEAARGYLHVQDGFIDHIEDVKLTERMKTHIQKMTALPIGAITPIVFSLQPVDSLASLVDEQTASGGGVAFDLDGTGRVQRWTWVKGGQLPGANAAILVWDPAGTGEIRSGRQLFGSVTWWLLLGDGYRAMDLLDDDRDGELNGAELRGLAAWFDRNADGISEPGEVVSLERLPIAAISVKATSRAPGSSANGGVQTLMNPVGLRLTDGTVLPTWDWVAQRR